MSTFVANQKMDAGMSSDAGSCRLRTPAFRSPTTTRLALEDTTMMNANVQDTGMMTVMSRRSYDGRCVKSEGGSGLNAPLVLRWPRIKKFLISILSSFSPLYP
ncbi:MAG: hypothetical protein WCV00_17710 [Verrucomicrobiia bacterium]|jgi:hypothetical protein